MGRVTHPAQQTGPATAKPTTTWSLSQLFTFSRGPFKDINRLIWLHVVVGHIAAGWVDCIFNNRPSVFFSITVQCMIKVKNVRLETGSSCRPSTISTYIKWVRMAC